MKSTIESTNTLKGIAILTVLTNHYLNLNVSGDSRGFANLFIVIFFMLSGYGIQHSLEKSFGGKNNISALDFFRFYFLRIIRIYPLFIIAYIGQCLVSRDNISVISVLGISAPGHYWFVPAIMQCYILAPFIHILMKKHRVLILLSIILSFVFLNIYLHSNIVSQILVEVFTKVHLSWRGIFFLYLAVFSLSMFIPKVEASWEKISNYEKQLYFVIIIATIIYSMIVVKYPFSYPQMYNFIISTSYPLLLIFFSTIYLMFNGFKIPIISFIGKNSYSIYLFHIIFYLAVNKVFGYGKNSIIELCLIIIFFPLFIYCCKKIELLSKFLSQHLEISINRLMWTR